jgi:hypothetical protein
MNNVALDMERDDVIAMSPALAWRAHCAQSVQT